MRVHYAHRSPGRFHSIEELFGAISGSLPSWVTFRASSAPRGRATPGSILANLRWAWSLKDTDLVHQTGDTHYAVLGIWRCPVVLTIHDLRFLEESRGLKRSLFWWLWLYLPCLRAKRVTVISEFTKTRLLEICRLSPGKVRVIPNCVAPEFSATSRPWPAGRPRVLIVGTTANKNLTRVAEACAGLDVQLCILGNLDEFQRQQLQRGEVNHESYQDLSKAEVVALYQGCDLVCFMSTYEGFGMPILEAQAVGRPVMTSNLAPMNSVAGSGALQVDPFDVNTIRAGLVRLLDDAALREELVRNGFENVKAYSAQSVAGQYAALYGEVLGRR